jgi:putative tricarboxylic transport membrane protein
MRTHQQAASLFWLIIGVYVGITAYRLGLGHVHKPGPGFIFFWTALFLIILSSIDLVSALGDKSQEKDKEKPLWSGIQWPKVLMVLGGLSIYVYIFNTLGFLISTFLLMIFLFKGVEPTKWWVSILGSLIAILITSSVFQLWLKVPFPEGIFGF